MATLETSVDTTTEVYQENYAHYQELVNELYGKIENVKQGGTLKARERHLKRGKLLARDRIFALVDPGTFFMELSPLAGEKLYESALPSAGIITGIGKIQGRFVMLIANDPTVKGGTYYPITVKKHLRAQEVAAENKLP